MFRIPFSDGCPCWKCERNSPLSHLHPWLLALALSIARLLSLALLAIALSLLCSTSLLALAPALLSLGEEQSEDLMLRFANAAGSSIVWFSKDSRRYLANYYLDELYIHIASLDGGELCSAEPSLPLSYLSLLALSLSLERSGITCFSHSVAL